MGAVAPALAQAPIPWDAKYLGPLPNYSEPSRSFHWRGSTVLVSVDVGWWHLSMSRSDRYPTWDELRDARYAFLPDDITLAFLLPPKDEYVNVHENCFHLHEVRGREVLG